MKELGHKGSGKPTIRSSAYAGTQTQPPKCGPIAKALNPAELRNSKAPQLTQGRTFDPIEYVQRHADSTRMGVPIAKTLNPAGLRNPKALQSYQSWLEGHDSIEVNDPCCQANGGCITKGLLCQLTRAHSIAADEAGRRQSTVVWHVSTKARA